MDKTKELKVDLSIYGRFHGFRLAEELDRLGVLKKFFIIYPPRAFPNYKIDKSYKVNLWPIGAIKFLVTKLNLVTKLDYLIGDLFDLVVSLLLRKRDGGWIFHGWSGFCERSLKRAKKLGAVTVVERSCPHIEVQKDRINEEIGSLGGTEPIKDRNVDGKMLREYEIADYIFAPSTYTYDSFIEKGFPPSKVKIVPICGEKMAKVDRDKKDDTFRVLMVGGAFYRKGVYYLLKAWNELNLDNAELVLRTNIPDKFRYLTDRDDVRWISHHLTDTELINLYSTASVYCQPSIDEGFGMTVLEAMSAGIPTIITDNVGAGDVVRDGLDSLRVPIKDVEAIKERILFMYNNPDKREEMGREAKETADRFSRNSYGEVVLKTYREIV